jgi:hypothetical protein
MTEDKLIEFMEFLEWKGCEDIENKPELAKEFLTKQ